MRSGKIQVFVFGFIFLAFGRRSPAAYEMSCLQDLPGQDSVLISASEYSVEDNEKPSELFLVKYHHDGTPSDRGVNLKEVSLTWKMVNGKCQMIVAGNGPSGRRVSLTIPVTSPLANDAKYSGVKVEAGPVAQEAPQMVCRVTDFTVGIAKTSCASLPLETMVPVPPKPLKPVIPKSDDQIEILNCSGEGAVCAHLPKAPGYCFAEIPCTAQVAPGPEVETTLTAFCPKEEFTRDPLKCAKDREDQTLRTYNFASGGQDLKADQLHNFQQDEGGTP